MKKTLFSIIFTLFSGLSNATPLYQDDINTLNLNGWLGVALRDELKTEIIDNSSRINFSFERTEINGWSSFAVAEWGINLVDGGNNATFYNGKFGNENGDDFLYNRLGCIGLKNDTWGKLSFGKQWGAYYSVAETTDLPNIYTGYGVGVYTFGDGGLTGTGRADSALQYSNNWGRFSFIIQYEANNHKNVVVEESSDANIKMSDSYGASGSFYLTDEFKLIAGFNSFKINSTDNIYDDEASEIYGFGFSYGNYYHYSENRQADGLYIGGNFHTSNKNELYEGELFDSKGYELMIAYHLDNGFIPLVLLSHLELDATEDNFFTGEFKQEFLMIGLHYKISDDTVLFVENKIDFSVIDGVDSKDLDGIALGINFFF